MSLDELKVVFADGFADELDADVWEVDAATWPNGTVSAGDGAARIVAQTDAPAGPGVMAYGGFRSRRRHFAPNLAGTNLLEVTLADFTHEGAFLNKYLAADGSALDHEDPHSGSYLTGFCLAIGSFGGLVGSGPVQRGVPDEELTDRVVQIHFDLFSRAGLTYILNRSVRGGDKRAYHIWGSDEDKRRWLESHEIDCPVVTLPGNSVTLAIQTDPLGDGRGWPHRYGLLLRDDGRTLSWLLDGKVMDTVDIAGFFDSSPGCVSDGVYVTIVGGGSYQRNMWQVEDVRVSADG